MELIDYKHLWTMSRFRCRHTKLAVVTAVWINRDNPDKTYPYCRMQATEDEVHLVVECPLYEHLRTIYPGTIYLLPELLTSH